MSKALTASQMKRLDQWAIQRVGIPSLCLMENAGRLVAEEALAMLKGGSVCVVCGAGNNGGDGFVAARHLANQGVKVTVVLVGGKATLSREARMNLKPLGAWKIPVLSWDHRGRRAVACADLIIDALLGIGLNRPVEGQLEEAVVAMNTSPAAVLSVDMPSGLDASTGKVWGCAVLADRTVTLARVKRGLCVGDGPRFSGKVVVADIGIPHERFI